MYYKRMEDYDLRQLGCPKPNKKLLEKADELFEKYIFYTDEGRGDKRIRSVTTTCCGQKQMYTRIARTMTPEYVSLVEGKHNETVKCPICGTEAKLKNLKRIKPESFGQYAGVMFLMNKKNKLYAIGAWAFREGAGAETIYKVCSVYSFEAGKAIQWERDYYEAWHKVTVEKGWSANKPSITEPLRSGGFYTGCAPYHVIGIECIPKTDMKYLPLLDIEKKHTSSLMRLFAMYSIYPQIEMFRKLGHEPIVSELVNTRRKNKDIVDWSKANICEAFGLSKVEYREWNENKRPGKYAQLAVYKKLRKKGYNTDFATALYASHIDIPGEKSLFKVCSKYSISPIDLTKYVMKIEGENTGVTVHRIYQTWLDYTNQARELGRDMTNHNVMFPKRLFEAHDETAEEYNLYKRKKEKKKLAKVNKEERKSIKERELKYNFEYEGMFIRVAKSAWEVTEEGRILRHCVAGYAQRHMANKTTILFLRDKKAPKTSLYTIEMDGNKLCQAHGYRNELDGATPPRKLYAELFEVWLDWINHGSKRDKNGNPIIRKKYRKEAA